MNCSASLDDFLISRTLYKAYCSRLMLYFNYTYFLLINLYAFVYRYCHIPLLLDFSGKIEYVTATISSKSI